MSWRSAIAARRRPPADGLIHGLPLRDIAAATGCGACKRNKE